LKPKIVEEDNQSDDNEIFKSQEELDELSNRKKLDKEEINK